MRRTLLAVAVVLAGCGDGASQASSTTASTVTTSSSPESSASEIVATLERHGFPCSPPRSFGDELDRAVAAGWLVEAVDCRYMLGYRVMTFTGDAERRASMAEYLEFACTSRGAEAIEYVFDDHWVVSDVGLRAHLTTFFVEAVGGEVYSATCDGLFPGPISNAERARRAGLPPAEQADLVFGEGQG